MHSFSFAKIRLHGLIAPFLVSIVAFSFISAQRPVTTVHYRTINVATEPGASVWIDGVLFGTTDKDGLFDIKTVSPGGHSIRVRADGFHEKILPLGATQSGSVHIPLVKTTDEAELAFQTAERLAPTDAEKSEDAYRKAIKLRPNYPEAYLGLARVLSGQGDLDEAGTAIASARKLRPGFAEASAVEGRIFKDGGDEAKAIVSFKRAITEGKGFQPEALTGLGILYKERAEGNASQGDLDSEHANYTESAKYFSAAVKQLSGAPDALVVYQLLGLDYERMHQYKEAIALYEEFLQIFPDAPEATSVRSFITQLRKQLETQ